MEREYCGLGIETLRQMLDREEKELSKALLEGGEWKELHEQRIKVTQLSIAVYQKLQQRTEGNPAEKRTR